MKTTKIAGQIFSRSDHLITELQQLQSQLNHNRCLLKDKIDKLFANNRVGISHSIQKNSS